jgi:hypothetical protein
MYRLLNCASAHNQTAPEALLEETTSQSAGYFTFPFHFVSTLSPA